MMAAVSVALLPSCQPFGSTVASVSLPRFLVLPRSRRRCPRHDTSRSTPPRSDMSSSSASPSVPPLPDSRVVVGCGGTSVDYLATVAAFPKPDDKIRSTSSLVQGGGNAGNALTGAARLGLKPRIISKLANDGQGRTALAELEKDGVDTSYIVVSQEGNSPFTYIIVDSQTNTRTCIHTPGYPGMVPDDLPSSSILSALDGARLAYFDVRLHETALVVAQEASRMKISILIDAEKRREGLDDLLNLASYVVCSEKFPQEWTGAPSTPSALLSILLKLPNVQFVVVTLGEKGCIMLERNMEDVPGSGEMDIDSLVASLREKVDVHNPMPTCIYSESNLKLSSNGIGSVCGRLYLGTAEKIPPAELIDTTGAGDAFISAVLYGLCAEMPQEKMLPFAARVAAAGCRALGARTGLPLRTDPGWHHICSSPVISHLSWFYLHGRIGRNLAAFDPSTSPCSGCRFLRRRKRKIS